MRRAAVPRLRPALLLAPLLLAACSYADEVLGERPTVRASGLELRRAPGLVRLAAWYCPTLVDDPILRLSCGAVLGPPPPAEELAFTFGLRLGLENPNPFPVPALDLLVALTLFRGTDAEGLGAICTSLCDPDDGGCDGAPREGACAADQPGARTLEDYAARVPALIAGLASGQARDELRKSTLPAGGAVALDLAFALGVEQARSVFRKTALRYTRALLRGEPATLDVPVAAEGTVFVRLPALGRVGVPSGPIQTTWQIR